MPTLYLLLGYPGSGKTTASKVIHELTGAVHLWADHIRRERFGTPTYTHKENVALYKHLNELTAELLAAENSVIFDTNFNFYKDREYLRQVAAKHGAKAIVIWVRVPKHIAKERATRNAESQTTRVLGDMPVGEFVRISRNMQPPVMDEPYIELDGTMISPNYVKEKLRDYLA